MNELALGLAAILLLLILIQAVLAAGFFGVLGRFRRELLADPHCPPAAVILCLRGTDPFLPSTLRAILDQDYPKFELRIMLDHELDPAGRVVEEVLAERSASNVVVQILTQPRDQCSLKCSSLVQAVEACRETIEFIAQLDADTIPHRSWLRELATALADERVGAATGNRWYMPQHVTLASLVRYSWNAAAVVQMYWYEIAWGGTLAVKTQVIRECGLLDRWSNAFCEDTMLFKILRDRGWQVRFVPSLMMVNRESCGFDGLNRWIRRQLLTARLYHPRWPAVLLHGLGTTAGLVAGIALSVALLALGNLWAAALISGAIAIYELAMVALLIPIEWRVRRIAASRDQPANWLSLAGFCKLLLAIPLTQFAYPSLLIGAMRLREVDWRGVRYRIDGPWQIRLIEYRPFEAASADEESTVSL